jgi:membrane complex biogenesis BtpA family protein
MKLPRLVGVIHLPPLAGAPCSQHYSPSELLQRAGYQAVQEAQLFAQAGFDGVILENFGDAPFYPTQVPPETVASMGIIAAAVREAVSIQVGINVLRNDARSALAIAAVTGCDFIRVNVLGGVVATDQGWIEGDAAFILRERERFKVPVAILADVHVKHGITFSSLDLGMAIEETGFRSLANAVIITGRTTGRSVDMESLQVASKKAREIGMPLYVGSGVRSSQLKEIRPWVDGVIVSSALRKKGMAGEKLDSRRVNEMAQQFSRKKQRILKK